jgi:exodeoxyribonuclease VIII
MNYTNGIHDLSNYNYHKAQGVSRSQLMRLAKSPKHMMHYQSQDETDTESTIIGSAVHTMLLEPELYNQLYAVAPNVNRRTKDGKIMWENYIKINQGKRLLSAKQYETIKSTVDALTSNPIISMLLVNASFIEKSIFFTHDNTGIQCKSRTDFVAGKASVDLKTTNDASYRAFQHSASKYGYLLQAAMTQKALHSIDIKTQHHVIIAVEPTPPYFIAVYRLDELAIQAGYRKFDRLMMRYQQFINNPDTAAHCGIETLYAPPWELDDE